MVAERKEAKLIKKLSEFKLPYIKGEQKVIVDWNRVAEMENAIKAETYSAALFYGAMAHLIDLGVLSLTPEGNYQLTECSILLNPRTRSLLPLYFTRKEDAEFYSKAMYDSTTHDSIKISRLSA